MSWPRGFLRRRALGFFTLEATGLTAGEQRVVSPAIDARGHTQPIELILKRTRWENNELFERTILVS